VKGVKADVLYVLSVNIWPAFFRPGIRDSSDGSVFQNITAYSNLRGEHFLYFSIAEICKSVVTPGIQVVWTQ